MVPYFEEYLPEGLVEELLKIAADSGRSPVHQKKPEHPAITGAKVLGQTAAGLTLGAASAYGAARLADHFGLKVPAKYVAPAGAIVGAGLGYAQKDMFRKQKGEMEDAIKRYHEYWRNRR